MTKERTELIYGMYNPGDLRIREGEPDMKPHKHFRIRYSEDEDIVEEQYDKVFPFGNCPSIEDELSELESTTFSVNGKK